VTYASDTLDNPVAPVTEDVFDERPFRRLASTTVPLTPELAQQFHDMEASPTERDLDLRRVKHLREKLLASLSIAFIWATVKFNGKVLRMNGNHSSAAILGLNEFPEGLIAHIDEYEANDLFGVALLFRQFDDKRSARSSKDICGAYQGLFENLRSVPKETAKLAVTGISWFRQNIQNPEGLPVLKGDDVGILFGETPLHPFIHFLGDLFTIKTPEMRKPAIVAAIYATYQVDENEAREFWADVARGGREYEEKSPSGTLDSELKHFADTKDASEGMTPVRYYAGCVYAWNAFRKGKPLGVINWDVSKGTPSPV
jgi:hypothetical protein